MSAGPVVLAVTLSILMVASGSAVAYVSWRSADQLVHPAREAPEAVPSVPFERVAFEAQDGVGLVGWWIPAEKARGTVIFLHGYADSKDQVLPLLPMLHDAGYHVLAYDARAHGESEGNATTVGMDEVADVLGALKLAAKKDPRASSRVALFGYSMGAATAINAASVARVDAIVADSAFATLENIASNSITHFTDLPKYPFGPLSVEFAGWMVRKDVGDNAPAHAAAKGRAPILVIQGLDDTITFASEDGKVIADAAPEGSELWLVPGAAHVQAHAVAPKDYEARVLSFLEEHLSR